MKIKKVIKIIAFILIFMLIWNYVFTIIWANRNSISQFYEEPKNSLDVVYIGSSNSYAHFNNTLAYHLYGYTTGLLASDGQPFALVEYLLKEATKYQKPNVYVIDINCITTDVGYFNSGDVRKVTDNMKFSKNRIDAINDLIQYLPQEDQDEKLSFYFSFLTYHNSWRYIGDYSFKPISLIKGHLIDEGTAVISPEEEYVWKKEEMELPEENKQILTDLMDYIEDEKLEVLFVIPPRSFTEENNKKLNYAARMLEDRGFKVFNANLVDEINIDFSHDLYNSAHLNAYGATKFTKYFAKYLKDNYNLKDHRSDEKYESWNKAYEEYVERFEKVTGENFQDYLDNGSEK